MKGMFAMKGKFPLGFWNYVDTGVYGPEAVKDWVDCGMNLCHSPTFDYQQHDPQALLDLMDECAKKDVKLVIADTRALWHGASNDPSKYREGFARAYQAFGKHPAAFGFYVGDEPRTAEQFDDAMTAYRLQLEVAPELTPLINMNPLSPKGSTWYQSIAGSFDEFADKFVEQTGLRMFSYDYYGHMNPQGTDEAGIDGYYYNLNKYSTAAKQANIPLWVTNLSVGHFNYRCPKEDDFRWQLNTSVASGANCVWWFFMYMRLTRINYRVAPIDEHWERSETFEWLSRVQRSFQHTFGALMSGLSHEKTYHCVKAYGGYDLFQEDRNPIVTRVEAQKQTPSILSFLNDRDGRKYLAVVNNSQTKSDYFMYHFGKQVRDIYRIAWGGEEINALRNDVCNRCVKTTEGMQNGAWLAPGQMEVYRLEL